MSIIYSSHRDVSPVAANDTNPSFHRNESNDKRKENKCNASHNMPNKVSTAQECDATGDHPSAGAGFINRKNGERETIVENKNKIK